MKKATLIKILLHVFGWALYFALPFVFAGKPDAHMQGRQLPLPPSLSSVFVVNGIMMMLFYLNSELLAPRLLLKKKYWQFLAVLIPCFFIPLFVQSLFQNLHPRLIWGISVSSALILLFSSLAAIYQEMERLRKQNQEIRVESVNQQIETLNYQINPHFLFNTLNSLYALSLTGSENTSDAILKLSDMMRYALSLKGEDLVSLSKEIQYIKDYVYLQELRLTSSTKIDCILEDQQSNAKVPPLLFITLIENAFKHGPSNNKASFIRIQLKASEKSLFFSVENSVHADKKVESGTGLGLQNCQRRLELLFPRKHSFTVHKTDSSFLVSLSLNFV